MGSLSPDLFLSHRRLALVGVSRDPASFSRAVFKELRQRGYDVVPVNPWGGCIDGVPCLTSVRDAQPGVEGAILMTAAPATADAVRECASAGISRVWMHRGVGPGAVSDEALAVCREKEIDFVAGACPFMFLPRAGWIHRAHGWWRRRTAHTGH